MRHDSANRRYPMLWLLTIAVGLLLTFAGIFEIDQAIRAQGQVIPSSRTQVIQAVDGGMLTALHVKEGDRVKTGQKLAELEPDRAQAALAQSESELASKRIALHRARAELAERPPHYGKELETWRDFIEAQQGIYRQRKQGLDEELNVLRNTLKLADDELNMNQRLYSAGDVSHSEVVRTQRQVLELQGRISATRNKYFQDIRAEIVKLEDELASSRYKLDERQNMRKHTDLDSPMDGIVKYVRVTTTGGVLRSGDELMQISPVGDELLVEIKINPADVAQLRAGLPVTLRFDAFDSSIYGTVKGTLSYISPDTLNEQGSSGQTQIYYRAQVTLDWPDTQAHGTDRIQAENIKPGMTATADILTGKRTILFYLLKPVVRAFSGAMTQR